MSAQPTQKTALNATLVNAMLNATTEVLGTMAMVPVTFKQTRAQEDYRPNGDISAVISIIGENGEGMCALSFPLKLANHIVAQLLGSKPETLSSDDRCDGVGEIVNMISGHAKASLSSAHGASYKLTLPTVIQGKDHTITNQPKGTPFLVLDFEANGEPFSLQVSFKTKD